jgi:hypothetical protein
MAGLFTLSYWAPRSGGKSGSQAACKTRLLSVGWRSARDGADDRRRDMRLQDADKVAHNLRTSSVVPVVVPPTAEALGTRALAEGRASRTRRRRRRVGVLVPPGPEEPEHLLRAAAAGLCGNQNLRRARAESSRRPPRHRRDACSMAWRCWFLTARPSQDGRVIAGK